MGIDEITSVHGYSVVWRSALSTTTLKARLSALLTVVTIVPMIKRDPAATTLSRQTSHIIPGPYFGYWNSSMSDVMSFWFRFGIRALTMALPSERPFTRWAAQSAGISLTAMPQTFSV